MIKKNQKICDRLCTPVVQKLHSHCLMCGGQVEVAHHFVHKSKSLALRYDIKNLIPLCGKCHCKLHHDETYWGAFLRGKMSDEDFNYLQKQKQITSRYFDYDKAWKYLNGILDDTTNF